MKGMAMQGSSSDESYARNSTIQNHNFHVVAKPFLAKAVGRVARNIGRRRRRQQHAGSGGAVDDEAAYEAAARGDVAAPRRRQHIAVADLGCSHGRNTLDCAEFVVETLQHSCPPETWEAIEVQYFFSDLPSNDFNALFQALDGRRGAAAVEKVRVAGVPGSFYGRLFPAASLDLVICSYSLHWLSQVPPSVVDRSSRAWNGGHTWIHQASEEVLDAYALQSQVDMKNFLNGRSQELASGGILFLFLAASSKTRQQHYSQPQRDHTWTLFNYAWKQMVDEEIITLEEMDMFNMPMYFLNEHELEDAIQAIPEFKILEIKSLENMAKQKIFTLDQWHGLVKSVTKSVVELYLGNYKAEELYKRLKNIASQKKDFNVEFTHSLIVASLERL